MTPEPGKDSFYPTKNGLGKRGKEGEKRGKMRKNTPTGLHPGRTGIGKRGDRGGALSEKEQTLE